MVNLHETVIVPIGVENFVGDNVQINVYKRSHIIFNNQHILPRAAQISN